VEDTKCVVKRVGNDGTLLVNKIHNVLGSASHHFIVYRVSDTVEQPDPFPCQPFASTLDPAKGAPIAITQRSEETIALPDGVAFSFEPNQMVRLELHYINATESTQTVTTSATFTPIPAGEFQHEADFMFAGDVNINIPANSTMTLGPTFVPIPPELDGVNFFAITGHEHQWGTNVTVEASAGNTAGTMVYSVNNFLWDEPETVFHDPPFTVPSGGGFRITCDWDNQSSSSVGFGEGANQEMCFFWTYYYPSKGAKVCFAHSQFGVTGCCPSANSQTQALCDNFF
jgi:hypothetical protein